MEAEKTLTSDEASMAKSSNFIKKKRIRGNMYPLLVTIGHAKTTINLSKIVKKLIDF